MESHFYLQDGVIGTTTSLIVLVFLLYSLHKLKNMIHTTKHTPPQPSGSWPFIGHLPLLGKLPHITFGNLADQYGPIFIIKLGVNPALVVSKAEMVKQCLAANDRVFANRPHTIFVDHLTYKSAMVGFAPYGEYWRQIRKIFAVELLSSHRIEMFKNVRINEVKSAIKVLHDHCMVENFKVNAVDSMTVDLQKWFNDVTMNSIVRLIAGKSMKEFYEGEKYEKYAKVIREFFELAGVFLPADALPFLRWMDIGGHEKKMKKLAKVMDQIVDDWLMDHKNRRQFKNSQPQDFVFMDMMLNNFETGQEISSIFDTDTIIKANCMNLMLAASDTSAATLTWALALLLNNVDILKKAQAELDKVVGKERQVEESDIKNLVYLQAIVKETLRLYPPGTLSVPREAIRDCTIGGYYIPAKTQLLVNLYKLHRDPNVWENPLEFNPERFIIKDYDVIGKNFEYLPFGSGRRLCPGISYALRIMHFTLASLLHEFQVLSPLDHMVDMTEEFGLSNSKATPLEVILKKRLPHD